MNTIKIKKEADYDEWLYDRLDRTIKMLDSGEMPTYTTGQVRSHIQERRAKRKFPK